MRHAKQLIIIFLMISFMAVYAYAGDLEPPVGAPAPTMHTLEDIYDKIDAVATLDKALPAKTGQTTSYDTGDDGDLEKGVAIPNSRFTDNENGTVSDNLTGLIWLKDANAGGVMNWANALAYCNAMADDGSGLTDGSVAGDWRLPNICELESLRNRAYHNPCISNTAGTAKWTTGDPFNNVQPFYYWSSTTYANSTSSAWSVYMSGGAVSTTNKTTADYVWPVRDSND